MFETTHTPGPFFTTCPHGGTIYVEARLRDSTIQEVAVVGPTETPEQQQANAKLFAAAPELLKSAMEVCEAWGKFIDSFDYAPGVGDVAENIEFQEMMRLRIAINAATQ
ncbi:DUF4259 domain-containing protein [Pseudomonas sp. IT-P12]|uniref:hypothetical protein n=1 Tax=Pseudomonas sp. IT-P12 TaxID=3026450 RepID=UPI0039E0B00A